MAGSILLGNVKFRRRRLAPIFFYVLQKLVKPKLIRPVQASPAGVGDQVGHRRSGNSDQFRRLRKTIEARPIDAILNLRFQVLARVRGQIGTIVIDHDIAMFQVVDQLFVRDGIIIEPGQRGCIVMLTRGRWIGIVVGGCGPVRDMLSAGDREFLP